MRAQPLAEPELRVVSNFADAQIVDGGDHAGTPPRGVVRRIKIVAPPGDISPSGQVWSPRRATGLRVEVRKGVCRRDVVRRPLRCSVVVGLVRDLGGTAKILARVLDVVGRARGLVLRFGWHSVGVPARGVSERRAFRPERNGSRAVLILFSVPSQ